MKKGKVYQTTAGDRMLYIDTTKISRLKTWKSSNDKKFPYVVNIYYTGNDYDGISYKDERDRDKTVKDLVELMEQAGTEVRSSSETLEQELKDYDPMGAIK